MLRFPAQVKQIAPRWRVGVATTIDDKDVDVVQGNAPDGIDRDAVLRSEDRAADAVDALHGFARRQDSRCRPTTRITATSAGVKMPFKFTHDVAGWTRHVRVDAGARQRRRSTPRSSRSRLHRRRLNRRRDRTKLARNVRRIDRVYRRHRHEGAGGCRRSWRRRDVGRAAASAGLRQTAYIKASNPHMGDHFGNGGTLLGDSVALSGDGYTHGGRRAEREQRRQGHQRQPERHVGLQRGRGLRLHAPRRDEPVDAAGVREGVESAARCRVRSRRRR